jgi:hypothetical protein
LILEPLAYFVSLLDAAGREVTNVVVQGDDDARIVTWARKLVVKRVCAAARVERRGGVLARYRS